MAASSDVGNAAVSLAALQEAVNGKDVEKADGLLVELKLAMLRFPALPPSSAASATAAQELQIARACYPAAGVSPSTPATPVPAVHRRGYIRSCLCAEYNQGIF